MLGKTSSDKIEDRSALQGLLVFATNACAAEISTTQRCMMHLLRWQLGVCDTWIAVARDVVRSLMRTQAQQTEIWNHGMINVAREAC